MEDILPTNLAQSRAATFTGSARATTISKARQGDGEAFMDEAKKTGLPLQAMVRDRIEHMILSGELKAGEHLNENALAAELNVSRGPIREATRSLADAGLLTIMRNRGAFVREISLEDVLHVYDVRAGLASVAGRLAALRATPEGVAELQDLWDRMEVARIERDSDEYYELNRQFHARIVEMTGNPKLIEFHEATERDVFLFLRRGVTGPTRIDTSNRQHKEMLDAIAAGDEQAAAKAFERHVVAGKQRMLDTLVSNTGG
jgi:DNA-binding GntR family transcriptional regulator